MLHTELINQTLPWVTDPETIVFCHGVATNCDIWAQWLPALTPYFKIARFDTRGFGRSHRADEKIDWTMDLLADDILAVAKLAGARRFHLVGESMGGTACLHLATRPDTSLLSLTCVSTSHRGGRIQRVGSWREELEKQGMDVWSDHMMERRFFPQALEKSQYQWFSDTQRRTDAASLLDGADLLIRTDLTDRLQQITVPTLLIAPDSSPFVPLDIPAEIHHLIATSEVTVFPKTRHGLPFSHAADCAKTLLSFLERNGFPTRKT